MAHRDIARQLRHSVMPKATRAVFRSLRSARLLFYFPQSSRRIAASMASDYLSVQH